MEPLESGETIKEATSTEIVSQIVHGESVTATTGVAGLFEIFEKAGDALAEYWSMHNDKHEPTGVIVEVAKRIQHSGIQVESTDVDLTDIYSASHPEMLKSICERLGIKIDNTSGLSQISRQSLFRSAKSIKESCQPIPQMGKDFRDCKTKSESEEDTTVTESLEIPLRVPTLQAFDKLGTRAFSTSCCAVDRVSRGALKHSWASPSPSPSPSPIVRNLAYLAMKLKRGVRLV